MSNSSAVAYLEGKKTQTNQPIKKTMKKIFVIWISSVIADTDGHMLRNMGVEW